MTHPRSDNSVRYCSGWKAVWLFPLHKATYSRTHTFLSCSPPLGLSAPGHQLISQNTLRVATNNENQSSGTFLTLVLQTLSCLCVRVRSACLVAQSCPTLCDPMDCSLPGSSVYRIIAGKNTGAGCHFLLQGLFQTQRSKPPVLHFLHWQMDSLPVHHRKTLSYSITISSNSKDFIFQTSGGLRELSILLDISHSHLMLIYPALYLKSWWVLF